LLSCVLSIGCAGGGAAETNAANTNAKQLNSNKPEPAKNAVTPFEKALFSVRVGDFDQVLVFRRTDGAVFTREDKDFLRQNSPNEPGRNVNRWSACEDEKCYIAGTNVKFTREQLKALMKRFDVKDLSESDNPKEITLPPQNEK